MESPFSNRLKAAAVALTGAEMTPEAVELLRYFGYDDADANATAGRTRLMRAGALFRRLFRLPVPDASGLIFFGAEADPSVLGPHNLGLPVGGFAGSGLNPGRAFEACIGEGIEYLSQFAQPDDQIESGTINAFGQPLDQASQNFIAAVFANRGIAADRAISWIRVNRLADGAACWYPADLCLRRPAPDFAPPLKLSNGCAAGVTPQAASLHAILELIERDAVALWWRGGWRGRAISPDSEAGHAAAALLAQLRQGQTTRRTAVLDITTDLGIPVVAAFSTRPEDNGFALGLSARPTQAEAVRSAIFEMCQSELSLHVIAAKQHESGHSALNESDRRQLTRAAALNPDTCVLLQPHNEPIADPLPPSSDMVGTIGQRLAEHGIVVYTVDLTRPRFDVPVVRIIAPALQSEPCEIPTARLTRAIQQTGGGAQHSGGITLL